MMKSWSTQRGHYVIDVDHSGREYIVGPGFRHEIDARTSAEIQAEVAKDPETDVYPREALAEELGLVCPVESGGCCCGSEEGTKVEVSV